MFIFNLNRPHKQKSDVNLLIQLRISVSITHNLPVESSSSTSSCFCLIIVFKRQVLATPQRFSTLTSAGVRLHQDTFDPPALLGVRGGRGQRGGTADVFLLHYLLSDSTDGTPTEIPKLSVMTKEFCMSEHQRVESVWNSVRLYCTWHDVDGTRGNPNSRGTQVPLEHRTWSFFLCTRLMIVCRLNSPIRAFRSY